MARILIGNIKGPKGDTGAKGATGPQGPAGPQGPLPPLTNNALATQAGVSALDAVMGKTLDEKIGKVNSDLGNVKTKFPGDTKQVVFNYDDSATIGLHMPANKFRLSLQRNSQWLGLLPIISTDPTGAIEFGQITLTKNNTTGNYDLHLYDIKGTWICKFTSTLS